MKFLLTFLLTISALLAQRDAGWDNNTHVVPDTAISADVQVTNLTASQVVLTDANKVLTSRALGISDDNILEVDGSPNNGEYAKFTTNGIEGKTFAQMLADLSGQAGAAFAWNSQNLTGIGTIGSGAITSSGLGTFNLNLAVKYGATGHAYIDIFEDSDDGANYQRILVPAMAGNITFQLPADDGDNLDLLQTDGSGALSWAAPGAPGAHKDTHDPEDGADPLDTANASEISVVVGAGTGTSHSLARADHVHAINHSIADNHLVTVDGTANNTEYAKFTTGGLEGKTFAEVLADLSNQALDTFDWNSQELIGVSALTFDLGTDINEFSVDDGMAGNSDNAVPTEATVVTYTAAQLAAFTGSANIVTLGTITTGVWNAGAITSSGDMYINNDHFTLDAGTESGWLVLDVGAGDYGFLQFEEANVVQMQWYWYGVTNALTMSDAVNSQNVWVYDTDNEIFAFNSAIAGVTYAGNYFLEGNTSRNILRTVVLSVDPGTTPNTDIDVTHKQVADDAFNYPATTNAVDLAASGSSGSYSLSADGKDLTLVLTETVDKIVSGQTIISDMNSSDGLYYSVRAQSIIGNLQLTLYVAGIKTKRSWLAYTDTGDEMRFSVTFTTSD